MKPTSPLSLLLFLQLVSASPLPETLFPSDCHTTSCAAFRSSLLAAGKPNTPPTRLTSPHVPTHQLSSPDTLDQETFNNRPITPSTDIPPSITLSSEQPLSSSFLQSLNNPASSPSIQKPPPPSSSPDTPPPSKPTSALPHLRKEDAKRYWASLRPARGSGSKDETAETGGPRSIVHLCGASASYVSFHGVRFAREYSDLMVVGIVVMFLIAVIALELVERVQNVGRTFGQRRLGRGEIYLEDDETVEFLVKRPISAQADPIRYQISKGQYQDEKEGFRCESDAS